MLALLEGQNRLQMELKEEQDRLKEELKKLKDEKDEEGKDNLSTPTDKGIRIHHVLQHTQPPFNRTHIVGHNYNVLGSSESY